MRAHNHRAVYIDNNNIIHGVKRNVHNKDDLIRIITLTFKIVNDKGNINDNCAPRHDKKLTPRQNVTYKSLIRSCKYCSGGRTNKIHFFCIVTHVYT